MSASGRDGPRRGPSGAQREYRSAQHEATSVRRYEQLAELSGCVGLALGTSDWIVVDQDRIDRFAHATGDQQWIHVDAPRAAAGPFGGTVGHGFLTLSLLPAMTSSAYELLDVRMGLNYGLNRVRFPAPVPVASRLRGHFKLLAFQPIEGGAQLTVEVTMEREGSPKPVCVAEVVVRCFTGPG
jgi:acyl dehydratase